LEIRDKEITVYPNPTTRDLTILFSHLVPDDVRNYHITNVMGQTVEEGAIFGNSADIMTSELDSGIYLIHFSTCLGTITKRFVKIE
jgi:hypothetical protein